MNTEFADLIQRCRQGNRDAMAELVARYEADVRIVARARVGAALRPHVDSVDLIQSLHRSVLLGLRNRKFEIETPEQLLGLARTIVQRKAARHWRKLARQRRLGDTREDHDLAERLALLDSGSSDPCRIAELRDLARKLLSEFAPQDQELLRLRLQGFSTVEAARQLGLDPDVTRARLSRIRRRLAAEHLADGLV